MSNLTAEIREIYQQWLDGSLSQEDALFSIGDALEEAPSRGHVLEDAGAGPGGADKSS